MQMHNSVNVFYFTNNANLSLYFINIVISAINISRVFTRYYCVNALLP